MKKLTIVAFLLIVQQSFSQSYRFFPEMEITSLSMNEGEVTLMTGEVIKGKLGLATMQTSSGLQRITSVRVRVGDKKGKYKAKEIKEILIKADWSDESLSEANSGDGLQIQWYSEANAEYYIFKSVSDKKGKTRLMQLVNPGFDHAIQVYADPKAKESSFAAMVGKDSAKSYYLTKGDGHEGTYVKKSKYKKLFPKIFGDCASMASEYGEKVKWGDLAQHIYFYDQECD